MTKRLILLLVTWLSISQVPVVSPTRVILVSIWVVLSRLVSKPIYHIHLRNCLLLKLWHISVECSENVQMPQTLDYLTFPKATCLTKEVSYESCVLMLECIASFTFLSMWSTLTPNC
jgi:hypothetical protein